MKKSILLFLLIPTLILSQESFNIKTHNVTNGSKFLQGKIKEIESVLFIDKIGSAESLYKNALSWINETYKNPSEVIKAETPFEYIRIEGSTYSLYGISSLGSLYLYDCRYSIEIRFKDNRFRFEVISFDYYMPTTRYSAGRLVSAELLFRTENRKGKIKQDGVRNLSKVKNYLEGLANGLKDHKTNTSDDQYNDW